MRGVVQGGQDGHVPGLRGIHDPVDSRPVIGVVGRLDPRPWDLDANGVDARRLQPVQDLVGLCLRGVEQVRVGDADRRRALVDRAGRVRGHGNLRHRHGNRRAERVAHGDGERVDDLGGPDGRVVACLRSGGVGECPSCGVDGHAALAGPTRERVGEGVTLGVDGADGSLDHADGRIGLAHRGIHVGDGTVRADRGDRDVEDGSGSAAVTVVHGDVEGRGLGRGGRVREGRGLPGGERRGVGERPVRSDRERPLRGRARRIGEGAVVGVGDRDGTRRDAGSEVGVRDGAGCVGGCGVLGDDGHGDVDVGDAAVAVLDRDGEGVLFGGGGGVDRGGSVAGGGGRGIGETAGAGDGDGALGGVGRREAQRVVVGVACGDVAGDRRRWCRRASRGWRIRWVRCSCRAP